MKSIVHRVETKQVINRSVFKGFLIPVFSVDEAKKEIHRLRKEYPDANHHCSAYIIGDHKEIQKYSDDGEPHRTAGFPMLEVLHKHDVTNILAVVVRHFGGIKLGAGGLVRAYSKSVGETMKLVRFAYLTEYTTIQVSTSFDQIGNVEQYIREHFDLLETTYGTGVTYIIEVESQSADELVNQLTELTSGNITYKILRTNTKYK